MPANYLAQLMGTAPNPSAMPAPVVYSAAMEKRARGAGFPSADAMMQWSRQRNTPSGGTITHGIPSVSDGMGAAAMLHPKNILDYILRRWQGATAGN